MIDKASNTEVCLVLRQLQESHYFDTENLADIANGKPVELDPKAEGAQLDLTSALHFLEHAVPVASGMLTIAKTLYDWSTGGNASPTAEDTLTDAFLARTPLRNNPLSRTDIQRIAGAVVAYERGNAQGR